MCLLDVCLVEICDALLVLHRPCTYYEAMHLPDHSHSRDLQRFKASNAARRASVRQATRAFTSQPTMKPVPLTAVSTFAAVRGVSNGPLGAIASPLGSFSRPITLA
jgi:hypothetical protein